MELMMVDNGRANNPKSTKILVLAWRYAIARNWVVLILHLPSNTASAKSVGMPQEKMRKKANARLKMVDTTMRHHAAIFCSGADRTRKKESPRESLMKRVEKQ
jgi:hypothetical protein